MSASSWICFVHLFLHFCLSGVVVPENKEKKNALFPSWWNSLTDLWLPCFSRHMNTGLPSSQGCASGNLLKTYPCLATLWASEKPMFAFCKQEKQAKRCFSLKVSWISLLGLCLILPSSVPPRRRCGCTHVPLHRDMRIEENCFIHPSYWVLQLWEAWTYSAVQERGVSRDANWKELGARSGKKHEAPARDEWWGGVSERRGKTRQGAPWCIREHCSGSKWWRRCI